MQTGRPSSSIVRSKSTHCSRRRFSQRATGLLRHLTFALTVEKLSDGDSGRSNVASIDGKKIPRAGPQAYHCSTWRPSAAVRHPPLVCETRKPRTCWSPTSTPAHGHPGRSRQGPLRHAIAAHQCSTKAEMTPSKSVYEGDRYPYRSASPMSAKTLRCGDVLSGAVRPLTSCRVRGRTTRVLGRLQEGSH